jgi:hypothetical protein
LISFGLSFDDQMDYDESELEVQVILVVFTCIFLRSCLCVCHFVDYWISM